MPRKNLPARGAVHYQHHQQRDNEKTSTVDVYINNNIIIKVCRVVFRSSIHEHVFPLSSCSPLASTLSVNQLQTLFHFDSLLLLTLVFNNWLRSSGFIFLLDHSASLPTQVCLKPFCQNKVMWPSFLFFVFCISRSYSLEQTPAQHKTCFFSQLFESCSKNLTFLGPDGTWEPC